MYVYCLVIVSCVPAKWIRRFAIAQDKMAFVGGIKTLLKSIYEIVEIERKSKPDLSETKYFVKKRLYICIIKVKEQ